MTERDKIVPWRIANQNKSSRLFSSSVLLSAFVVLLFATLCSSGTVPQRPGAPAQTDILGSNTGKKGSGRVMHAAFENAGRVKGLELWRIENFEPVAYPKNDYGKFFTGDSFIVLNTKESKKKVLSWDVHFWLGLETSQDEAGAAAIYTVQLDDILNGAPIQHREVQNHESQLFLSYFKNGVRYQAGGIASGFNKVEVNARGEKRLFQVKGKKNVRVNQVDLAISSMNQGDCFILDDGREIYVYVGTSAKRIEKIKAISAANQIRDQDHSGRATVHIVDEYSSTKDSEDFFTILGSGSKDTVPDASIGGDDDTFEVDDVKKVVLYHVSDAGGSLQVSPVSEKPLKQAMLDTKDCFILDTGSGIYVWIGKGATPEEKKQSMSRAQGFISSKKYPTWTQVHRITEGAETTPFKQYFSTWRDYGMTHSRLIRAANDNDSENGDDEEFDPSVFHALKKSGGRALGFMPDDGEGDMEIWRIQDLDITPVEEEKYGMFFGGDSYIVKYEYRNKRGGQGTILYYWQGKHSSYHEKAASAMHVVRLDNEMDGAAVQVRVTQGNEPRHFLKIFKGKLIVFDGGHSVDFNNVHDHGTYDADGTRLFRVRGTCPEDVRAVQLAENASSLASDDVFILETPSKTYLWNGAGASDLEKDMATGIVERISPDSDVEAIEEGSEPAEFWNALGGESDYDKELDPPGTPFLDPRLFHCRILYGNKFRVEEVPHFEQEDLNQDDIMVLDGGDEIYIWEGQGATEDEKEKSIAMANQYIKTDPSDRSEDTVTIIRMRQYKEPRSFKRLFPSWDDELWEKLPTYEEIRNKTLELNALADEPISEEDD